MSLSHTFTASSTFSITHAREIASRVIADLHLCSRLYGKPTGADLNDYLEELAQLIKQGYIDSYEFGFKKDGVRVVCWRYTVGSGGELESDRPGKLQGWVDVTGACYYNFMTPNQKWWALTETERTQFKSSVPVKRSAGSLPGDGCGYWTSDRTYASGGIEANRQTYVPYR